MAFNRRLVFYCWADSNPKKPFDRVGGTNILKELSPGELVLEHGDEYLTAVEIVAAGSDSSPSRLLLHALHGPESRPSQWGPGEGSRSIEIGENRYTAFTSHVSIWGDQIAAFDAHANAPGLGRLSAFYLRRADQRVAFHPLYEPDATDRLNDLESIRGVEFSIHDSVKVEKAKAHGMISELLPSRDFPSIQVSAGMGQASQHDDHIDDDIAGELFEIADVAEQFFDRIKIRGLSKTRKTKTGQSATVEINLLTERLQVEHSLKSDPENPSMPEQDDVFEAPRAARTSLEGGDKLARAAEGRLAFADES